MTARYFVTPVIVLTASAQGIAVNVFERLGGQHLARTGSGAVVLVAPVAFEADDADDADDHRDCAVLRRTRDESQSGPQRHPIPNQMPCDGAVESNATPAAHQSAPTTKEDPVKKSRAATKRCPTRHPLTH